MKIRNEKIRKARRWAGRLVRVLVLGSVIAGTVHVVRHPPSFLRVKDVVVMSPLKRLNEFDLIRLSEVRKGDNILTLRLRKVRERILRFPWVKDVRVSKRFPARLFLWVEEQDPAALLELQGQDGRGELFLVNRDGRVFKKLDETDPKDFAILTGLSVPDIPERLPRLMALVESLEASDLFGHLGISEAHWDSKSGLTLFTKEPCIQFNLGLEGGERSWEERLQRFARAWETIRIEGRIPRLVDLSLDRRIVVKEEQRQRL